MLEAELAYFRWFLSMLRNIPPSKTKLCTSSTGCKPVVYFRHINITLANLEGTVLAGTRRVEIRAYAEQEIAKIERIKGHYGI